MKTLMIILLLISFPVMADTYECYDRRDNKKIYSGREGDFPTHLGICNKAGVLVFSCDPCWCKRETIKRWKVYYRLKGTDNQFLWFRTWAIHKPVYPKYDTRIIKEKVFTE